MSKKAIQWLYQELPGLIDKGVISHETALNLQQHYGVVATKSNRWIALIVCSIFGAVLIGLGIISLFGHNWENLSRATRTVLSLTPLIASQILVGWTLLKRADSQGWKEGAAVFLTLMVGSSIALIGQTYHVQSTGSQFLFPWMMLIIPLVYLTRAILPAMIYVVGITAWSLCAEVDYKHAILFWPLAALVIPYFWSISKDDDYTVRSAMLGWIIAICLCIATGHTLGKFWRGVWIVNYASLYAILYLRGVFWPKETATAWQRPYHSAGAIGIFGLSFMLTFKGVWKAVAKMPSSSVYYDYVSTHTAAAIPDYILSASLLIVAIALLVTCVRKGHSDKLLFGSLPVAALIGYGTLGGETGVIFPVVLFNLYLFMLSVDKILTGVRGNNLGILNAGMLMLSMLIIARFFDVNLDFITRGIIFILIGAGFLAMNLFMIRRKGETK